MSRHLWWGRGEAGAMYELQWGGAMKPGSALRRVGRAGSWPGQRAAGTASSYRALFGGWLMLRTRTWSLAQRERACGHASTTASTMDLPVGAEVLVHWFGRGVIGQALLQHDALLLDGLQGGDCVRVCREGWGEWVHGQA